VAVGQLQGLAVVACRDTRLVEVLEAYREIERIVRGKGTTLLGLMTGDGLKGLKVGLLCFRPALACGIEIAEQKGEGGKVGVDCQEAFQLTFQLEKIGFGDNRYQTNPGQRVGGVLFKKDQIVLLGKGDIPVLHCQGGKAKVGTTVARGFVEDLLVEGAGLFRLALLKSSVGQAEAQIALWGEGLAGDADWWRWLRQGERFRFIAGGVRHLVGGGRRSRKAGQKRFGLVARGEHRGGFCGRDRRRRHHDFCFSSLLRFCGNWHREGGSPFSGGRGLLGTAFGGRCFRCQDGSGLARFRF